MRKEMKLTEKDLQNQERLRREIAEDRKNKKHKIKKGHVSWWCNFIGYVLFGWLIWDVFHFSEYLFVEWRVNFGIFKFFATIILLAIAGNLNTKKQ